MIITPAFSNSLIISEPSEFVITVGMNIFKFRLGVDPSLEGGTFEVQFNKEEES